MYMYVSDLRYQIKKKQIQHLLDQLIIVGVLWRTGSCSRLVISGSMVRSQPSAYTPRQGILSTIVSLNPGVLNGYLVGFFLKIPQR